MNAREVVAHCGPALVGFLDPSGALRKAGLLVVDDPPPDGAQEPDPRAGFYYVSVRRPDGDYRLLRGPFENDHARALFAVDAARARACELDPKGHWYAYGTCRLEENAGPGILDKFEASRPIHYQTGRGTLCSLDNDASVREPTADRSSVSCKHCLELMTINAREAA